MALHNVRSPIVRKVELHIVLDNPRVLRTFDWGQFQRVLTCPKRFPSLECVLIRIRLERGLKVNKLVRCLSSLLPDLAASGVLEFVFQDIMLDTDPRPRHGL